MGIGVSRATRLVLGAYYKSKFLLIIKLLGFEVAAKMFSSIPKFVAYELLLLAKANIGPDCDIETPIYFHNCRDLSNLIIGENCHIGKNCFFDLRDKVIIGKNVVVAMQCTFITHLDLSQSDLSRIYPSTSSNIIIGNDAYIGAGSITLMGVVIGESSFVAAGSVVRNDVPKYSLVAGVPAKFIKQICPIE